ncbi:hypothetical protein N0V93_009190 [Gnomoniopsis smithogilvyi]|uniref:Uncharacterized protein n=1 Tax=Gnomoniopsis smithogilvyi TaxID=1191159 RepID=A0A9W8YJJ5_9PEZI|nr:hypothetical protein N0V93_009190 [Gnomoniopsis smithogilvyi]
MKFATATVFLASLLGVSVAQDILCSCNGSVSNSASCCNEVTNYETWTGYECGVTSGESSTYATCCGGSSATLCRQGQTEVEP